MGQRAWGLEQRAWRKETGSRKRESVDLMFFMENESLKLQITKLFVTKNN
jgi:hypothetical protein